MKLDKKRVVMEAIYRGSPPKDRSFDVAFWQACGTVAIFAAADDMLKTALLFQGRLNEDAYRLRRSVETIQRASS